MKNHLLCMLFMPFLLLHSVFSSNTNQPQMIVNITVPVAQDSINIETNNDQLQSSSYADDKKLIEPYFDEHFYKDRYADDLEKTGLSAIDHFMQYGWQGSSKTHHDPNEWFNVTLYKERLWPCAGNPFVDFLKQPKVDFSNIHHVVEIFVKDRSELFRAWMAAEAFLRLKTHKILLRLAPSKFHNLPVCFKSMVDRGLMVELTNDGDVSFYKSPFIQSASSYGIFAENETKAKTPILHNSAISKFIYIKHDLYHFTEYLTEGRINPLVINFAYYTDEPLHYCPFAKNKPEYKAYFERIHKGYDLVFTGLQTGLPNERILPGFIYPPIFIKPEEISSEKKFGVSYLLSLGFQKGDQNFWTDERTNYNARKNLWTKEKDIIIPHFFYVSRRAKDQFSQVYQDRILPTDSKKWILDSQFSIAIENGNQINYMSEKLLDCFSTLTVPIYIGCPNATDYFDARGMLIAENIDDIIRIVNALTPDTYTQMLPYLKKNKELAENLIKLRGMYIDMFYQKNMA